MLEKVKTSLRINNVALDAEVQGLIDAAKDDLRISGVLVVDETDSLIIRAITTYCKANFGWNNPDAEKLRESFESIKNHLSLSTDYAFYAITFSVSDATNPIRMAKVTFNDETKTTDANGQAIFYVRKGTNYEYAVAADGYAPDDDEENLLDVSASQTVAISLAVV